MITPAEGGEGGVAEEEYLYSIQRERREHVNPTVLEGFETSHKSSCVQTVEVQHFLMWLHSPPPQEKQSVFVIVCGFGLLGACV